MKNLKINIPEGYEIDEKASTFTNIVFKPIVKTISAEERMTEIWRSCNIVKYSEDNCRTYFRDENPMFQSDWNNNKLYYNYTLIYQVFKEEYNMSIEQINSLILSILSKDIKCPSPRQPDPDFLWCFF